MSRPALTEELNTFGALLRAPLEALLDHMFSALGESGFSDIRPAHGLVLRYIADEGSRIVELAERARMTKQSMGELVAYLRRHGYVELVSDPSDGRAKLVRLTKRGRRLYNRLLELSRGFENECAAALGTRRWKEFRLALADLAEWSRQRGKKIGAQRITRERRISAAVKPARREDAKNGRYRARA
jgi:DNA-binding MarR family transcriptional regulator